MDDALNRLTFIQQSNINKRMFSLAYSCVTLSGGNPDRLVGIVKEKTYGQPNLAPDLLRYCRLVDSIK
jgi:hypothetical protein